jgi:hypothetical protein
VFYNYIHCTYIPHNYNYSQLTVIIAMWYIYNVCGYKTKLRVIIVMWYMYNVCGYKTQLTVIIVMWYICTMYVVVSLDTVLN